MPSNPSLLSSPKQRHGGDYEKIAADFLQQQGLVVLAKNWQQPNVGEIDLILLHPEKAWNTLVFAEVRKRKVSNYGDALMSITRAKQRKLIKTARFFLRNHPNYAHLECRFDVVAFNEQVGASEAHKFIQPEWVQGAFIANAW